VDPDGKQLNLFGELAEIGLTQLQNYCKNIHLTRNSRSEVEYTGSAKTTIEKILVKIIDDTFIKVNIVCGKEKKIPSNLPGGGTDIELSGAFLGSQVVKHNKKIVGVLAYQYVLPDEMAKNDNEVGDKDPGGFMIHEVIEAYIGAKIAKFFGKNTAPAIGNNYVYNRAHRRAGRYMGGVVYNDDKEIRVPSIMIGYKIWTPTKLYVRDTYRSN